MVSSTSAMLPTSTISGMSMASSTGSSTSMSSDTMMGMQSMEMTFFTSSSTPLYSMSWSPSTAGQYAGTCVFLMVFAAIFRALLVVRTRFDAVLSTIDIHRNGGLKYHSRRHEKHVSTQWRANEALLLAFIDVIIAGISYLLFVQHSGDLNNLRLTNSILG